MIQQLICFHMQIFMMNLSAPFICEFFKDAQEKVLQYAQCPSLVLNFFFTEKYNIQIYSLPLFLVSGIWTLFLETKQKQEHSQKFMAGR